MDEGSTPSSSTIHLHVRKTNPPHVFLISNTCGGFIIYANGTLRVEHALGNYIQV